MTFDEWYDKEIGKDFDYEFSLFHLRKAFEAGLHADVHTDNSKVIAELKAQIEKMKCCENCKYNSYWGNELHCNYGLKEALLEDKLVECKEMDKWEIKEND